MNNIQLNIVANAQFQQVYAEVAKLKSAMMSLQKTAVGGPFTPENTASIKQSQQAFDQAVVSTRAFTIEHVAMADSVTKFGKQLSAGQLSLSNYYKIWRDSAKGTSAELDSLAASQSRLNRSIAIADPLKPGYAKLVTDINGVVTAEEKAIFYQRALNTALQQGSMKLIDFGKNTQWMGRQLTVGLTMPLAMFGASVSQAYLSFDQQMTSMLKVYGSHAVVQSQQTLDVIKKQVTDLADKLARTLGVAMSDTVEVAKTFSSIGLEGQNLIATTEATVRLQKLGDLTAQSAANSMVSLQNVFKLQSSQMADAVNFLNAAKHSTSTTMQDIVDALPRVGPIIQQLGGTYKDFTAFLVALKESGVPAAQGANAIKSMLASIINPTSAATKALQAYHINLKAIVSDNTGNPMGMVKGLQSALNALPTNERLKAIEQIFGKFQFARVTALLNNLGSAGSQSAKVLELYGKSNAELASVAQQELDVASKGTPAAQFQKMKATLQADLIPLGRSFLETFTKIGDAIGKVVSAFKSIGNVLGPVAGLLGKVFGGGLAGLVVVGPIIMLVGLFSNLIGNIMRGANAIRMFKQGMESSTGSQNKFLAGLQGMRNFYQELDKSAIASRNQMDLMPEAITSNAKAFEILRNEITKLTEQFKSLALAQSEAMTATTIELGAGTAPATTLLTQMRLPGMASGGWVPGRTSDGDTHPTMLTGGEAVIPAQQASRYAPFINAMIDGVLPGHAKGKKAKGPVSVEELLSRQKNGRVTQKAHQGEEFFGQEAVDTINSTGTEVASRVKSNLDKLATSESKLLSNFVVDQDTRINQVTNTYKGVPRRGATGEAVASDLGAGSYASNFVQIANKGVPVDPKSAAKLTAIMNEYQSTLLTTDEQFKTINSTNNKFITSKMFEKIHNDIKSGSLSLTEAEKQLLTEMEQLNKEFNTMTVPASQSASGAKTGRAQERLPVYTGSNDPALKSYTAVKAEETAAMAAAIKAHYEQEKQVVVDTFSQLGRESALAAIDGIKKGAAATMNEVSRSASDSKETKQAAANIAGGAVHELADKKYVRQAQAAGAAIATAEVQGVQKEIPVAMAAGAQIATAEVVGASGGGNLGSNVAGLWSRLKANSFLGKRAAAGTANAEEAAAASANAGSAFGFKAGLSMMMGNMALNAVPNKIGGTDISGAKGIASSMLSVGSTVAMIPGLNAFTPEIMAAVGAVKTLSLFVGDLSKRHKEHALVVQQTYTASTTAIDMFNNSLGKTPDILAKNISKLKDNDSLKNVANYIKSLSGASAVGAMNSFISSQVISGMDPKNVELMVKAIVAYTGQTDLLDAALKEITKDNKDLTTSTTTYLNKLSQQTSYLDVTASSYKNLTEGGKNYATGLYNIVNAIGSGSLTGAKLTSVMSGLAAKTSNSVEQMHLLQLAADNAGNTTLSNLIQSIQNVIADATQAKGALIALQDLQGIGLDPTQVLKDFSTQDKLDKFLGDPKAQQAYVADRIKTEKEAFNAQQKAASAGDNATAGLKQQLTILKDQKKVLDDQIKAEEQKANAIKAQNDYLNKQTDLTNQIKQAEITGNYIQAAQLTQQQQQNTAQYKFDTKISDQKSTADSLQTRIDELNTKISDIATAAQKQADAAQAQANFSKLLQEDQATITAAIKAAVDSYLKDKNGGSSSDTNPTGQQIKRVQGKNPLQDPVPVGSDGKPITTPGTPEGTPAGVSVAHHPLYAGKSIPAFMGQANVKQYQDPQTKIIYTSSGNAVSPSGKFLGRWFGPDVVNPGHYVDAYASGGHVKRFDNGGGVRGPGTPTSDSIPAYLSNGEYVIKAAAVNQYGKGLFDSLNSQKFAGGGMPNPISYGFTQVGKGISAGTLSFLKNIKEVSGVSPTARVLSGHATSNWDYLGMLAMLAGPAKFLGILPKAVASGIELADLIQFGFEKKASGFADGGMAGLKTPSSMRYANSTATNSLSMVKGYDELHSYSPFDATIVDPKKQSKWSKFAHSLTNSLIPAPLQFLTGDLSKSLGNIIGGDARWNDFTNIGFNVLPEVKGAAAGLRASSMLDRILPKTIKNAMAKEKAAKEFIAEYENSDRYIKDQGIFEHAKDKLKQFDSSIKSEKIKHLIAEDFVTSGYPYKDIQKSWDVIFSDKRIKAFGISDNYINNYISEGSQLFKKYKKIPAIRSNLNEELLKINYDKFKVESFLNSKSPSIILQKRAFEKNQKLANQKNTLSSLYEKDIFNSFVNKLPGGLQGTLLTSTGVHRSTDILDVKNLIHPSQVPVKTGRLYGPGLYEAITKSASDALFKGFGDNVYKIKPNTIAKAKLLFSKGYIDESTMALEQNKWALTHNGEAPSLSGASWNDPFFQYLMSKGYIGFKHRDAITNWMVGTSGWGLKPLSIATKAMGGLVSLPSYKVGTPYVPENQLAFLHKGEAVIPANQNTGGTVVNVTVNATGVTDPKIITQMAEDGVMKALQIKNAKINKSHNVMGARI